MVIDADGLHHVTHNHDLVAGYSRVVLTPNHNELSRLAKSLGLDAKLERSEMVRNGTRGSGVGCTQEHHQDALVIADVLDLLC